MMYGAKTERTARKSNTIRWAMEIRGLAAKNLLCHFRTFFVLCVMTVTVWQLRLHHRYFHAHYVCLLYSCFFSFIILFYYICVMCVCIARELLSHVSGIFAHTWGRGVAEFVGPENDGQQNNISWKMQDLETTDLGISKVANNDAVTVWTKVTSRVQLRIESGSVVGYIVTFCCIIFFLFFLF